MPDELLPCPFCGDAGEKGVEEWTDFPWQAQYTVTRCLTCGASCPAANWNMRAPVEGPKAPTFGDWQAFHDSMCQAGATEPDVARAAAERDEAGLGMLVAVTGGRAG
ncbi:hypothetical protein [Cupriavidus gilardii]|uniref:hypothetical protein n=1 Tax=Cupriavidus gilardii TaxID=82541 RepID=UPI0021B30053|nr:hypothetical protein [Cupriavidus gilardii]UXC37176.1 hypothetical protein N4G38_06945 [Cupriavidus gilardii]